METFSTVVVLVAFSVCMAWIIFGCRGRRNCVEVEEKHYKKDENLIQ